MQHNLETVLAAHPFCEGLSASQISTLASCATSRQYFAGDVVFRQGEEAKNLLLIRRGTIAIEISAAPRGALTLQTVGDGEVLGWTFAVPPYVHRYDARAVNLTRVVSLECEGLRDKFGEDKDLGYVVLLRLLTVMAKRLEGARIQMLDLYGPTTK